MQHTTPLALLENFFRGFHKKINFRRVGDTWLSIGLTFRPIFPVKFTTGFIISIQEMNLPTRIIFAFLFFLLLDDQHSSRLSFLFMNVFKRQLVRLNINRWHVFHKDAKLTLIY